MRYLITLLLNGLALIIADYLIPGFRLEGIFSALLAAFILGLVNTLVRPLLILFTLPLTILTFGLFIFVVNAIAFSIAALLVPGFTVFSFWGAFWGAIFTSVISWALHGVYNLFEN
ncbi:MAG: phage holin family protein [Firmicutes bacterium]|nr:phage holin family protein [Bacillota bacterium]